MRCAGEVFYAGVGVPKGYVGGSPSIIALLPLSALQCAAYRISKKKTLFKTAAIPLLPPSFGMPGRWRSLHCRVTAGCVS